MSSLGIALLILVFMGIGGVIAYNAWLARREGRQLKSLLAEAPPIVSGNRAEPSLDEPAPGQASAPVGNAKSYFEEDLAGASQADSHDPTEPSDSAPAEPLIGDLTRDAMSGAVMSAPITPDSDDDTDESNDEPTTEQMTPDEPQEVTPDPQLEELPSVADEPVDTTVAPEFVVDEPLVDPVPSIGPAEDWNSEEPQLAADAWEQERNGDVQADATDLTAGAQPDTDHNADESRFDCVVRLMPLNGVGGTRLRELTKDFTRVGGKPVIVAGIPVGGTEPETLEQNTDYDEVVTALLLVNRSGPVNPMEFSEFANRTQAIAEELDVLADVPDMNDVLERARSLDSELGTLDAQVAVNVETDRPMSPGDLLSVSKRLNLTEQGNNRFVRASADRQALFSVALGERSNRIVLLLDVPRVARDSQPIREMVECAWHCCQAFEGRMVDDSGRPIDNALFDRIESQLDTHYQALQGAGVPAGSEQARRVFN